MREQPMFWEIKIISNKVSDYYQVLVIRINPNRSNTSTGGTHVLPFFKGMCGSLDLFVRFAC